MKYDCIVIGAGHAGCEAAHAVAEMGNKTLLITSNLKNIADMPCNPSIGGSAKGIVVREIDALGGIMGEVADKTKLQIKLLNTKKGPGVRSLRAQVDKEEYPKEMLKKLKKIKNLDIIEDMAIKIIIKDKEVKGVKTEKQNQIDTKKVILTTGTYLNSYTMIGHKKKKGGPHGERSSLYLSDYLKEEGIDFIRLKTGTPPRIDKSSIDFSKMKLEPGDNKELWFSNYYNEHYDVDKQIPCYLTFTNEETHTLIRNNLEESSLYGGLIHTKGPRYCPSIEDKIVKFSDKERHQLFIEPQSLNNSDYYLGGFSTTMPEKLQEKIVHTIKGLENAKITKYAYAIEYDVINPTDLKISLESKKIKGLYSAGQINGTSGYEEAAAQGLIAGINASLSLQNKSPLVLKRSEAYIGVLLDDLITKGITEPYRLLTSRAEFRLYLRSDNASYRLAEIGKKVGILSDEKYQIYRNKLTKVKELENFIKEKEVMPNEINEFLKNNSSSLLKKKVKIIDLAKRQELSLKDLMIFLNFNYEEDIVEQVDIFVKYEGYIKKTIKEIEKMSKLEDKIIPEDIDYNKIHNIATEAKQKLSLIRPNNIGQASRISGVNPADISVLLIYLKKEYANGRK